MSSSDFGVSGGAVIATGVVRVVPNTKFVSRGFYAGGRVYLHVIASDYANSAPAVQQQVVLVDATDQAYFVRPVACPTFNLAVPSSYYSTVRTSAGTKPNVPVGATSTKRLPPARTQARRVRQRGDRRGVRLRGAIALAIGRASALHVPLRRAPLRLRRLTRDGGGLSLPSPEAGDVDRRHRPDRRRGLALRLRVRGHGRGRELEPVRRERSGVHGSVHEQDGHRHDAGARGLVPLRLHVELARRLLPDDRRGTGAVLTS